MRKRPSSRASRHWYCGSVLASVIWTVRPLEPDAPHQRAGTQRDGVLLEVAAVFGGSPERDRHPVDVALALVDHARIGGTQPDGVADHRLEDRLHLRPRATDRLQNLVGHGLLLDRVGEIRSEPVD